MEEADAHELAEGVKLHKTYMDRSPMEQKPTEAQIREILAKIGKHGPEDELNCGACGYPSCRDKAVAGVPEEGGAEYVHSVYALIRQNPCLIW